MVSNTLHAAAILLKEGGERDWFINLSASDYPLVIQDAMLHTLSTIPRDLNFLTSDIGWKEFQRAKPVIIDPGLSNLQKSDVFWVSKKRSIPTAYKLFTGSAWMMLSRPFMEFCLWGWDNLPRIVLMYYVVLDIRFSTLPVVELPRHQANAIAWAPHSSYPICPAGDDSQALIWDLSSIGQPIEGGLGPILAYTAGADIAPLQWSSSQLAWVAIAFSTQLPILRILPLTHVPHTVLLASSMPIRQLIDSGHPMVDATDKAIERFTKGCPYKSHFLFF
ncbi:unnamed protein product [Camellia sinensis]